LLLSHVSSSIVSSSPLSFLYPHTCFVALFLWEDSSLHHTVFRETTNIFYAGKCPGLACRLRSSTCINAIFIVIWFGFKSKGTLSHISCISLFNHIYNRLSSYYGTVSGIRKSLFQEGLVTCVELSNWS